MNIKYLPKVFQGNNCSNFKEQTELWFNDVMSKIKVQGVSWISQNTGTGYVQFEVFQLPSL